MLGRGSTRPSFAPLNGVEGPRAFLRFLTPTRLRVEDDQMETATFSELVEAMLRRVLEIAYFNVPGTVLAES